MTFDEQLEELIDQTINGAISTIPAHLSEIEQNKEILKVSDPKEFVYGVIMGMSLGMASALMTAQKQGVPSQEDQIKIRDLVYSKIPQIRDQIFNK